jgi:hypothetical protein
LHFFGQHQALPIPTFANWLRPLRQIELVVYTQRPFAGPEIVLATLRLIRRLPAGSSSSATACDWQASDHS